MTKMWKVSYENAAPVEVQAEIPAYPHRDAGGDQIFANTHFLSLNEAWEKQLAENKAGFHIAASNVREARRICAQREAQYVNDALLYDKALQAHRDRKREVERRTEGGAA